MRKIAITNKYKKDLELAKRRHLPMDELNDVIYNLANDILLPKDKKDHGFKGDIYRLSRMSYKTRLVTRLQKNR